MKASVQKWPLRQPVTGSGRFLLGFVYLPASMAEVAKADFVGLFWR
jgi:hypothetical protein